MDRSTFRFNFIFHHCVAVLFNAPLTGGRTAASFNVIVQRSGTSTLKQSGGFAVHVQRLVRLAALGQPKRCPTSNLGIRELLAA